MYNFRKSFPILILSASVLCCSCRARSFRSEISAPPNEFLEWAESEASPFEFSEFSEAPPAKTAPEIWDVSDVDISEIDPNRKLIAFTFDDSPSRTLENIFAVFAAFNEENPDCKATATVFFNSSLFDASTPHLLLTASALGFELGNHTHSHADLTTLSAAELRSEIDRTDELLAEADGKPRHLLRPPFGKANEQVKAAAETPIIDWTIDTLDWTGVSEDEIYNTVFDNRFSGAIVLMHDGYEHTVDALKRLLPDLQADGYQVVGVSQLAKAHGCTLKKGRIYIRARKQLTNP